MKARFLLPIFLFLLIFPANSFAQTIPNLPTLQKYVNDYAGILSSSEISSINNLAAQIEANSTVQIAVLTINSTQPYAIQDYAVQTFRANGIGQKQNDNGILIVVAVADRQYFIETGYGLEGLINDAKAGDIGRACFVDNFRNNQYGDGIYCAVQDIGNIVEGQPEVIANLNDISLVYVLAFLGIVFFPIFILIIYFANQEFNQKCPRCGTRMHVHVTKDGIIYECPKCHYKKKKKRQKFVWLWFGGVGGGWSGGGGGGGGFGGGSSGGGGGGGGW
jgi:uncharacterized protein